ncbi:MAG: hypothetical protein JOZ41_08020, partial [Chloroflexi bacterium]|nr:hypothetical protein [Chloroflexota bacterium]
YVCDPADPAVAAGTTTYGETFCSAVLHGSIWGLQFHPERSGRAGLQLIKSFCDSLARNLHTMRETSPTEHIAWEAAGADVRRLPPSPQHGADGRARDFCHLDGPEECP